MQILANSCDGNNQRPSECRACGFLKLHSHGTYERGAIWQLGLSIEEVSVRRYLCVGCLKTTSVLPWGLITYRLLSIFVLAKSLYDRQEQRSLDLLRSYRRRWEGWYWQLWSGIGNLFGLLPREAHEGWKKLGFEGMNPKLVDQSGWSLFGRYRIHAPQRVI
jgi:hypothetical protein